MYSSFCNESFQQKKTIQTCLNQFDGFFTGLLNHTMVCEFMTALINSLTPSTLIHVYISFTTTELHWGIQALLTGKKTLITHCYIFTLKTMIWHSSCTSAILSFVERNKSSDDSEWFIGLCCTFNCQEIFILTCW